MTTKTFPITGLIDVSCRLGFGAITVHADQPTSEAKVVLTPRTESSDILDRTIVEMRGSTLVVQSRKPRGAVFDIPVFTGRIDADALDVDITVPPGTPLRLASYAADVVVHGRCGSADIASGASSTQLGEVDGRLRLRYGSGPSHADRVRGSVVVKCGSGAATFGEVDGPIDMACGTGSLDVTTARGRVRMRTGTGHTSIGIAEGDVEVTSGSGALSVGLRPGQSARLDVVTGGGQLRSDLPVEDHPPATAHEAITIRARTGSGDVHVFRAGAAGAPAA